MTGRVVAPTPPQARRASPRSRDPKPYRRTTHDRHRETRRAPRLVLDHDSPILRSPACPVAPPHKGDDIVCLIRGERHAVGTDREDPVAGLGIGPTTTTFDDRERSPAVQNVGLAGHSRRQQASGRPAPRRFACGRSLSRRGDDLDGDGCGERRPGSPAECTAATVVSIGGDDVATLGEPQDRIGEPAAP